MRPTPKAVRVPAFLFATQREALRHARAGGGRAVLLDAGPAVVADRDAERLLAAGASFAFLAEAEMPDGSRRVVTVPAD